MEIDKKQYGSYVKQVTPVHNIWKNMLRAFLIGGVICLIGQIFIGVYMQMGMDKEAAASWTTLSLIALSVILITGFANSVVAPAIEYKAEGQVFGIGCKIFTIAGPVILYGILSSWVLGIIYWIGQFIGII